MREPWEGAGADNRHTQSAGTGANYTRSLVETQRKPVNSVPVRISDLFLARCEYQTTNASPETRPLP